MKRLIISLGMVRFRWEESSGAPTSGCILPFGGTGLEWKKYSRRAL
jgi:hypothetical protein